MKEVKDRRTRRDRQTHPSRYKLNRGGGEIKTPRGNYLGRELKEEMTPTGEGVRQEGCTCGCGMEKSYQDTGVGREFEKYWESGSHATDKKRKFREIQQERLTNQDSKSTTGEGRLDHDEHMKRARRLTYRRSDYQKRSRNQDVNYHSMKKEQPYNPGHTAHVSRPPFEMGEVSCHTCKRPIRTRKQLNNRLKGKPHRMVVKSKGLSEQSRAAQQGNSHRAQGPNMPAPIPVDPNAETIAAYERSMKKIGTAMPDQLTSQGSAAMEGSTQHSYKGQ
jgi:hypothetical protein